MHTLALEYVASTINGKIIHGQPINNKMKGNIPDVVSDGVIHEVEVFHISHKVQGYSGLEGKKILWIVFDANPLLSFDSMNFLVALNGHIIEPSKDLSVEWVEFKKAIENQIREDKDELSRLLLEARIEHAKLGEKKQINRKLREELWKLSKEEKEYISKVNQAKTLDRDIEHKAIRLRDITEQVENKTQSLAVLEKKLNLIRRQVKPIAIYAEYKSARGIVSIRITKEQFEKLVPSFEKAEGEEEEEE